MHRGLPRKSGSYSGDHPPAGVGTSFLLNP